MLVCSSVTHSEFMDALSSDSRKGETVLYFQEPFWVVFELYTFYTKLC